MSSHGTPIPMTSRANGPLTGTANVPGDKSISHRSLILGALCVGRTDVTGLLEGQDVLDTAKAMQAFGAEVTQHAPGKFRHRCASDYGMHGDFANLGDLYRRCQSE
jgi:3-phosphoshikimate 1-carboxyvinyltransferase